MHAFAPGIRVSCTGDRRRHGCTRCCGTQLWCTVSCFPHRGLGGVSHWNTLGSIELLCSCCAPAWLKLSGARVRPWPTPQGSHMATCMAHQLNTTPSPLLLQLPQPPPPLLLPPPPPNAAPMPCLTTLTTAAPPLLLQPPPPTRVSFAASTTLRLLCTHRAATSRHAHAGKLAGKQAGRQAGRPADRPADRRAGRQACELPCKCKGPACAARGQQPPQVAGSCGTAVSSIFLLFF